MKSTSSIMALSVLGLLASSIATKPQGRHRLQSDNKFSGFNYPARAKSQGLGDNRVDLGYEVHQASVTDTFLAFKNIPYAEPPLDGLRWFEAIEPQTIRPDINNGSVDHKCPQAQVGWVPFAQDFLQDFGNGLLPTKWRNEINPEDYGSMPESIDGVDENCLTLDVMVPKSVWEKKQETQAAVIVWIYGGGFVFGWKDQYGSPTGLFEAASKDPENDGNVIYVAMNYRLGAFGFLGGSKFREDGGIPNLGLRDQEFAMKWVTRYIEDFGGDPTRVTVMGQSAGASSILHHITAGGGQEYQPAFSKAILQSAGFFPQPNCTQDDVIYKRYLELTGAKDLDELITLNSANLQEANAQMTFESKYGYFNFGPTIDDGYVPDLPGKLLKAKSFHKGVAVLLGHTAYDGLLFTPPWIRSSQALLDHSKKLYPGIPDSVLSYIDEHYPIKEGALIIAQKKIANVSDFLDDIAIQCNSYYLTEASLESDYPAPVFRYSFNALPAIHGYDVGYTYYPSPPAIGPVDATLAKFLQTSIVNFARFGDPSPENETLWELYSSDTRKVMNLGAPSQTEADYSFGSGDDKLDRGKCAYWQDAPYFPGETGKKGVAFGVQDEVVFREGL